MYFLAKYFIVPSGNHLCRPLHGLDGSVMIESPLCHRSAVLVGAGFDDGVTVLSPLRGFRFVNNILWINSRGAATER